MRTIEQYKEQIYAGVLGKLLGVYMGRPVEGWSYEKIMAHFGEINFYKNTYTGAPLIVPDDDISGTFAFFRALEDSGYDKDITAAQIGDSWLNYIVENKTILWWGGLSRSTEHTAYLRLKHGIKAPYSGSIELNGRSMAEQIGAQIFIDTWAMVHPSDPAAAAKMAREAASVSHDGIAVDAAVYLAAMQAMAFDECNVNTLLEEGLRYVQNPLLHQLVADIREQCAKTDDWHIVRAWIAKHHNYDRYPGNCPMITNHLVVLMALLMGGDNFQRSVMIATSAGWDTDCNAGNVGALNAIRLGLSGFEKGADLRSSVADRLYVCTADGGQCISDAVLEARAVIRAAAALRGETVAQPSVRYAFEYAGATQGFVAYPDCVVEQALCKISNTLTHEDKAGLRLEYKRLGAGVKAMVSVDTFIDMQPKGKEGTSYFDVITSPSLYATQIVTGEIEAFSEQNPILRLFIDCYDSEDHLRCIYSNPQPLCKGSNNINWSIPDTDGHAIYRIGLELTGDCGDGSVVLRWLDWSGAPVCFRMGGSMEMTPSLTPWTTQTTWLKSFVSTAENFCPDYTTTFSISHPNENGVVTTGTRDWSDYTVKSRLTLAQQNNTGLVARARGHRRYYSATLTDGKVVIAKRVDERIEVLATVQYAYEIDSSYTLAFSVQGERLTFMIDEKEILTATDSSYQSGGAGFLVDSGAILADGFTVCALN